MEQSIVRPQSFSVKSWVLVLVVVLVSLLLIVLGAGSGVISWLQTHTSAIVWSLIAIIFLWVIPGLVMLRWLWSGTTLQLDERLMLSLGVGMMLPPIVLNLLSVVHMQWGTWQTWLYIIAFMLLFGWQQRQRMRSVAEAQPFNWYVYAVIGLLSSAVMLRLYMVRDLIVPMWNDSYHHTLITQLLADHGGLFTSWEPYAQLYSFTYHYGFHANAVFFHWLTGIDSAQSVLLFGQIANVASVACAYALTTRLGGSRLAGIIAFVATGFINTMPVYYVNWGRYTQLLGHVLLIVMLISWMSVVETGWNWRGIIFAVMTTSALALTHYLVTLFGVVMLGSYLLIWLARDPRWQTAWQTLRVASIITVLAIIVTLPWNINLFEGRLTKIASGYISGASTAYGMTIATFGELAPFFLKMPLIIAAVLGMWVAVARRNWRILLCVIWSILLQVLVVPFVFSIPLTGVISGFASAMSLYMTVIPLAAYALADTIKFAQSRHVALFSSMTGIVAIGSVLWASSWQPRIINDGNQMLFTPADRQAMEWIKQHTSTDAVFLINGYPGYGRSMYIADDGGTWIPYFTGRQTTLPPMTYGSERGATPNSTANVREFYNTLYARPLPDPSAIQLCLDAGVDYIYIGPHVGTVIELQRINVQALRYRPKQFPIVYERDGVIIFAIKGSS